jgi:hypothetical protein
MFKKVKDNRRSWGGEGEAHGLEGREVGMPTPHFFFDLWPLKPGTYSGYRQLTPDHFF